MKSVETSALRWSNKNFIVVLLSLSSRKVLALENGGQRFWGELSALEISSAYIQEWQLQLEMH